MKYTHVGWIITINYYPAGYFAMFSILVLVVFLQCLVALMVLGTDGARSFCACPTFPSSAGYHSGQGPRFSAFPHRVPLSRAAWWSEMETDQPVGPTQSDDWSPGPACSGSPCLTCVPCTCIHTCTQVCGHV